VWYGLSGMIAELPAENTEVAILGRVLESQSGDLPAAAAQAWLNLRFPENDATRLRELSAKAKLAELSAQEEALLENYLHVGRLIDLMKSKARLSLKAA
jgi:hypothetical protein